MQIIQTLSKISGILAFVLFLNITPNYAATITWLGGTSNWDIAANWDSGTVPSPIDEVIIPSGVVYLPGGFTGYATHIDIASGAKLQLRVNSALTVDGANNKAGIYNLGTLKIYGALIVQNITATAGTIVGNGITNHHQLLVGTQGTISVDNVAYAGIAVGSGASAKFINKGHVTITNSQEHGISTEGVLLNYGTLDITHDTAAQKRAIIVSNIFKNFVDGEIYIDGGYEGIATATTSTKIKNWGYIKSVFASFAAFRNNGNFTNYPSGTIEGRLSGHHNFYNASGASFLNQGICYFWESDYYGMSNLGTFINEDYVNISGSTYVAYYSFGGSLTDNHGHLNFSDGQDVDLRIFGTVNNHSDGYLSQRNKFDINASGILINEGILQGVDDEFHTLDAGGVFENHGAIWDNYDNFVGIVDNQQVIISPISDPLQNGVPYSPALTMVANDKVSFGDWVTSNINGIVCGSFDETTNTFTPNNNAIGLTTIFLSVSINASSIGSYVEIPLTTAVAPLIGKDPQGAMQFRKATTENSMESEESIFEVFPNPTSGLIHLVDKNELGNKIQIALSNGVGQVVFEKVIDTQEKEMIQLPKKLPNGFYFLNIYQDQQLVDTKKIQVLR